MKQRSKALAAGAAAAFVSILAPATASATGACYVFEHPQSQPETVDGGTSFALRYIPTKVGQLTSDSEARQLAHLKQEVFSLVGKVTAILARCDTTGATQCNASVENQHRVMTTADGTIITGKVLSGTYPVDGPGAHLGVNVHLIRRIGYDEISLGPVLLECSTERTSATPSYWDECNLKLDIGFGGPYFFQGISLVAPFTLTKVNPLDNPACSVFQDGNPVIVPNN
jgi:hypothetical protein